MLRPRLVVLLLGVTWMVAACGGTTVDNDEVTPTSVAPLTRASTAQVATPTTEASPDQGAQEISEIPTPEAAYTPEQQRLLDRIADQGIEVTGVEPQLIETANLICRNEGKGGELTAGAIGGQLVEQGLTQLDATTAAKVIVDSAREAYC